MKKAFLASVVVAQVTLIAGLILGVVFQYRSQELVNRELGQLRSAADHQDGLIRDLDQTLAEAVRQMDGRTVELHSLAEEVARLDASQEGRAGTIAARIAEKPLLQPLRWAYVDRFRLMRFLQSAEKGKPEPADKKASAAARDELIGRAIRQFAEGKFDLLIDKTFGDHQILYRGSRPVLDVSDAVEAVLKDITQK